jgi:N utilization substance protein B
MSGRISRGGAEKTRPRTLARMAAVQALFQSEQAGQSAETVIDQFIRHRFGDIPGRDGLEEGHVKVVQVPLFARIVRTAVLQQDTLDDMLAKVLPEHWPLERIDPVLRALMRAGAAELWMSDGPPARVVINEYLDVAHGFFSGEESRLANGVLDRLAHLLRPADFTTEPGH